MPPPTPPPAYRVSAEAPPPPPPLANTARSFRLKLLIDAHHRPITVLACPTQRFSTIRLDTLIQLGLAACATARPYVASSLSLTIIGQAFTHTIALVLSTLEGILGVGHFFVDLNVLNPEKTSTPAIVLGADLIHKFQLRNDWTTMQGECKFVHRFVIPSWMTAFERVVRQRGFLDWVKNDNQASRDHRLTAYADHLVALSRCKSRKEADMLMHRSYKTFLKSVKAQTRPHSKERHGKHRVRIYEWTSAEGYKKRVFVAKWKVDSERAVAEKKVRFA